MRISHKKIRKNWLLMIVSIILGFTAIAFYIFHSDLKHTQETSDRFDEFVRKRMETVIEAEVNNRINEIEYQLSKIHEYEKEIIARKIAVIRSVLVNAHLMDIVDVDQRRLEAVKLFEAIVENDPEYLYFAVGTDGVLLRSGTDETLEGISMMDAQDKDGTFFIREIVKAKDSPEGKYVTYYWPNEKDGEPLKKTSFCLYIPEFDFIIATGSYEVDVEERLKAATFDSLQEYYEGDEDYVFIVEYSGVARVFGDAKLVDKDIRHLEDANGVNIFNGLMKAIESTEEGYFTYYYHKRDSDWVSEKITYVKRLDRWNAYIGMGYHSDDLIFEIEDVTTEFNEHHFEDLIRTIMMLGVTICIIFFLIRRGVVLQARFMKQEDVIFEQLFQYSYEGLVIVTNKGKVVYKNPMIIKMMGEVIEDYLDENAEFHFSGEADDVHSLVSPSGRRFFVEVKKEQIIYHGMDAGLYFIKDVTEAYMEANKFQQMALYDELTSLPNRRKLMNDLEDMTDGPSESLVMAMIDLDHFKHVNDTYGHDVGDQVLQLLGICFKSRLREGDEFYRYGGEEFIALLKNITLEDTRKVLRSINDNLNSLIKEELGFNMTFSAGVVQVDLEKDAFVESAMKAADRLLYQAKEKDRSRVEIKRDDT